jgi:hypothetical protein
MAAPIAPRAYGFLSLSGKRILEECYRLTRCAKLTLPEGADVNLKFAQDVSSKTAVDDDPVARVLD